MLGADFTGARVFSAILERTDLEIAKLGDVDLKRARLGDANLRGAELMRASLRDADLSRAKLIGADLSQADLTNARFIDAELTGANLDEAILNGADLSGADLSQARLKATSLGDTNLTGVKGLESCKHIGPSYLDYETLTKSGILPSIFLRGCGLPERLIEYLPSLRNEAIQFYSCFISYSHADKTFARRLHDTLQGRGIRCWLDEHQLLPGDDIYDHVDRGIRLWDKVLLCCSAASLTSWWVDNELGTAFEKEQQLTKLRGRKVQAIVPLNLDGFMFGKEWQSGYGAQIRRRLAPDFTGWEKDNSRFEAQIENVVKALRADERFREVAPVAKL